MDGGIPGGRIIEHQTAVGFHRNGDLLPGQGAHELVDDNGKTGGCKILAKPGQQVVVAAALDDGLTGAVGVCLENHASVIFVFADQTQIKGNVIGQVIQLQCMVNRLQPLNGADGAGIVCQTAGLL